MNQKQLGAFYTPRHTVQYMLSQISRVVRFDSNAKVLEPSGGDGIFVSGLLDEYKQIQPSQIDVRDINPDVQDQITPYGVNFSHRDSLLHNPLTDGSRTTGIYSHIIGNPPYLNKQSDYIKQNKKLLKPIYDEIGVHDTYAMFIYLCCQLLQAGGVLGFIVSDTFLTLGIHKKLRKFLLEHVCIQEITICPKKLFPGVTVSTCIIIIENKKPDPTSTFIINDCRQCEIGNYDGIITTFNQQQTQNNPDYVFNFNGNTELIQYLNHDDKLIDYVDGGLGMHTKDNNKYLAIVDYDGKQYAKRQSIDLRVKAQDVDGKQWKFYHKQGGDYSYFLPAEYAVKWDDESVNQYVIPSKTRIDNKQQGFIISGVCSRLSARLSTIGAMWESNKAMCFFPKNPEQYPCEYFLGLLNSSVYAKFIKFLNHTNSVQIRDIYKLPMLHVKPTDKDTIIDTVRHIIKQQKKNINYDFSAEQQKIDQIVNKYFSGSTNA